MRRAVAMLAAVLACGVLGSPARGEVRVVSYNIENFRMMFDAVRLPNTRRGGEGESEGRAGGAGATTQSVEQAAVSGVLGREARDDNEECWEVASVLLDPEVNPDILMIQESAGQKDLEYFNRRWLNGAYETVMELPTNTDPARGQHLAVMMKPGFRIIDKVHLHAEKDPTADGKVPEGVAQNDMTADPDSRGGLLFARGPSFLLVEAPTGYRFWVGNTHFKSKSGNSVEVTKWRNREAARTVEVMQELKEKGVKDVLLVGDFNDAAGVQDFDAEGGGDTITNMVTSPKAPMVLVTKAISEDPAVITYHGYWGSRYRSTIDHAVSTPEFAGRVKGVSVYTGGLARVASDHYPVVLRVEDKP